MSAHKALLPRAPYRFARMARLLLRLLLLLAAASLAAAPARPAVPPDTAAEPDAANAAAPAAAAAVQAEAAPDVRAASKMRKVVRSAAADDTPVVVQTGHSRPDLGLKTDLGESEVVKAAQAEAAAAAASTHALPTAH